MVFMGFLFIFAGIFGIYQLSNFPWYLFGAGPQIMSTLAALIPVIIGIGLIVVGASSAKQVPPQVPQSVVVREVVTVKVRCSYCGTLYDETLDRCPNCGAKRWRLANWRFYKLSNVRDFGLVNSNKPELDSKGKKKCQNDFRSIWEQTTSVFTENRSIFVTRNRTVLY